MRKALTPHQRRVLILKANGYSNHQAAREIGKSRDAINHTLHRIYRQLNARNCTHAVAIALRLHELDDHAITIPTSRADP